MEQVKKEQNEIDVRRDVDEARRQLASGNVREASVNFDRAKVKAVKGMENGDEVKQLEKDLQNAQASNLIHAQSEFTWRNNGQVAGGENAPIQTGSPGLLYDAAAAQQQSAKLQEAQEIVTAQIQPLHVNLPVRGVHFAFTQVLQTEPGKPMTILMQAVNTRAVNWPTRLLMPGAAFLLLWGMVALVSRLTARSRTV